MTQYEKMYLISEADYLAARNVEPAQLPEAEPSLLHRTPIEDELPMFEPSRQSSTLFESTPVKRVSRVLVKDTPMQNLPPRVLAESSPIHSPDTTQTYENESSVEILNNSLDDAKVKLIRARQVCTQTTN